MTSAVNRCQLRKKRTPGRQAPKEREAAGGNPEEGGREREQEAGEVGEDRAHKAQQLWSGV